jgi:hypothetical protein
VASSVEGKLDAFSAQGSVDALSMMSGSHQDSFAGDSLNFDDEEMPEAEGREITGSDPIENSPDRQRTEEA